MPGSDWWVPPVSTHPSFADGSRSSYAKAVPRLSLMRSFRPIFWTQKGPFLRGKKIAFPQGKEEPPHSTWASSSETSVCMHNTDATADVSPCNGISTILGQHKICPDRDDNERTRPVTTPSVRTSQPIRPHFVPLDMARGAYDASLT